MMRSEVFLDIPTVGPGSRLGNPKAFYDNEDEQGSRAEDWTFFAALKGQNKIAQGRAQGEARSVALGKKTKNKLKP
jgi:hypothetical protein